MLIDSLLDTYLDKVFLINKYIGKEIEVLFEEEKNGIYEGHTQNYIMMYCKSKEVLDNEVKKVKCKIAKEDHILAEL